MQAWVDGTANNGLSVRCDDSGHEIKFFEFYSRDYGTASYRPQLIVTYQSPGQPDLIVEDIWISPDPTNARQSTAVSFKVKNENAPASGVEADLYVDGEYQETIYMGGFSAGGSKTYQRFKTLHKKGTFPVKGGGRPGRHDRRGRRQQ